MSSYAKADTLMGAVLAPLDQARSMGLAIVFSLFIAACAQFTIHIGPIPITGQSFAVLLTGALLGSRLGTAAVIAYLIEGAIGLPFFAPGGAPGILRFLGPTGGYLVAFPAAAFITGAFAENGWDRRFLTAAAAMSIGSIVILLAGWSWLVVLHTPPVAAFNAGVKPFLLGDVVKVILAAAVLPTGWAILKRKASQTPGEKE